MDVLIAGNWKMHLTPAESVVLADGITAAVKLINPCCEVLICPSYVALSSVKTVIEGTEIRLGAQNMHSEPRGAFTGEIAADMLRAAGCDYVLCGHSERRHVFQETDTFINEKVLAALDSKLKPILCIGETLEERHHDLTASVVERQLRSGLQSVDPDSISRCVIAYEPVWAIGTGQTATPEQARDVHRIIRELLIDLYPAQGQKLRILYGGSVKPDNIDALLTQQDINGALVGGASLTVNSFSQLIKSGSLFKNA
jgi:triosephosphate isomerase (TIM)